MTDPEVMSYLLEYYGDYAECEKFMDYCEFEYPQTWITRESKTPGEWVSLICRSDGWEWEIRESTEKDGEIVRVPR